MYKKDKPLVSVVLAVYNRERYVAEAIESILTQTYSNLELLIVNDGSTDKSDLIIKQYMKKDKRIKYISSKTNLGQSGARNVAICQAHGDFIAISDSDDLCMKNRLKTQIDYYKKNFSKTDVLGSYYLLFSDSDTSKTSIVKADKNDILDGKPPVHNPTCMIKADVFKKYGTYDSQYDDAEDVELWFRWFHQGVRFFNLEIPLYKKRNHEENVSTVKVRHQVYLMLRINLRAIFFHGIRFSINGYLRIFEQFGYYLYLALGLNKIYSLNSKK
jgi:glycosyltransferase involved in cell wall biosynthesis